MSARGRGRARGRARGEAGPGQEPPPRQPGGPHGNGGPAPAGPQRPGGAWGSGGPGGPGARPKQRPEEVVYQQQQAPPQQAMQQAMAGMSLQDGASAGAGGGDRGERSIRARRRGFDRYQVANYMANQGRSSATHGSEGAAVKLVANYIPLIASNAWVMYHYHCFFLPDLERADWRRKTLQPHLRELGIERRYVFDNMALYISKDLGEEVEWTSAHPNEEAGEGPVTVQLKRAATNAECRPNSLVGQHIINVLFKKALRSMKLTPSGRSYYNMDRNYAIPEYKLDVFPGFSTAIAEYGSGRVMLQIDVAHRILRNDTAYDVLFKIYQSCQTDEDYERKARMALLGQTVMTKYNSKTYRITDINFKVKPTDKFNGRDGEITYIEYYNKAYGIKITDDQQPMLVSKPKGKDIRGGRTEMILLVPEICFMTGLTDDMTSDFNLMKALHNVTRMGPLDRVKRYHEFAKDLRNNEEAQESFSQWDLKFDNKTIQIDARRLPAVRIYMKSHKDPGFCEYNPNEADWSKGMRDKSLISTIDLGSWIIIHGQRETNDVENLLKELTMVSRPLGFRFQNQPKRVQLRDTREFSFKQALSQNIEPGKTQLVFCVIGGAKSLYDVIKKFCCIETPIVSQCMKASTLRKKGLKSIATKIILQMQCKLGAELWAARTPDIPGMGRPFMIVGMDVYHDSERKGESVVGFVSSLNRQVTKYYSQVMYQTAKQELATKLNTAVISSLKKFHECNGGRLPETVIVYRDGVGDGQLDMVLEQEIPQFQKAFEQANCKNMKLLYIVVQKRINTRLFLKQGEQYGNPMPGTVVDKEIVRPEWYDFFLVSQSVRQGTVSPTHFNILYDTVGWTPDQIQKLSYMLTHLYYNWQGTIRVPAPCQYAHKLAYLVGTSLHAPHSPLLSDRLWYL